MTPKESRLVFVYYMLLSLTKAIDLGPSTPMVSIASGEKKCLGGRLLYLFYFLSSAAAATLPGAGVASVL